MNETLWKSIQQFDFAHPPGEYSFSIRLANENKWTKDFTEKAILEYKKFMYLAAISDVMVSPSAIVDTVWHQHLIFTQSYQDFCTLIGKEVQHVPSIYQKDQADQFSQAKERTKRIYNEHFGVQPKATWECDNMFDGLNLSPAKFKLNTFMLIGILIFLMLIVPFYYLLKSIYIQIDNSYFILGLAGIVLPAYVILDLYNRNKIKQIMRSFDQSSFVHYLKPFELVYLKTHRLPDVISGSVNELIDNGTIKVVDLMISISNNVIAKTDEQLQIVTALQDSGRVHYPELLRRLEAEPIFRNTSISLDAFSCHFSRSNEFGKLFYSSFIVLTLLLMLPLLGLISEVVSGKPITQMVIAVVALLFFVSFYLYKLSRMLYTEIIPNLYKNSARHLQRSENDWQWSYFLNGSAVLNASFLLIMNYDGSRGDSFDGGGGP
jgi:hypothetical protein